MLYWYPSVLKIYPRRTFTDNFIVVTEIKEILNFPFINLIKKKTILLPRNLFKYWIYIKVFIMTKKCVFVVVCLCGVMHNIDWNQITRRDL